MPAQSSGRPDQSASAGHLSLPVQAGKHKKSKLSRISVPNAPQEQQGQGQLVTQRSAQSQRITARIADRALLDAYIKAGLDDAGVRKFFRGSGVKGG